MSTGLELSDTMEGSKTGSRESWSATLLSSRRPLIVGVHLGIFAAAMLAAYPLRFEQEIPAEYVRDIPLVILIAVALKAISFGYFRLYSGLWRYTSYDDAMRILKATTAASVTLVLLTVAFGMRLPRSIYLLDWLNTLGLTTGLRFAVRGFRERTNHIVETGERRAIIVGAGDAAEDLLRSLHTTGASLYEVVGLVDDDRRKQGAVIRGAKVLGAVDTIPQLAGSHGITDALLALPSAPLEHRRRIAQACRDAGVVVRTVPPLRDLVERRAGIAELEDVDPEDLLRRERVEVDLDIIRRALKGKRVLVTGAAGSIGHELCLQIASFEPEELTLYERAESNLYFATLELQRRYPDLKINAVIGDICDSNRVAETFDRVAPAIVYHAAAYKHVPLMEQHPLEAIRNNVFGTEVVARQSRKSGVETFVLISTDKAVAPAGVMGMSKRVAEGVLLSLPQGTTVFTAVRFGNVLGSEGSVLPLFRWQLASKGPVTVTHEDATRYFMLTSEAAQLVMQAGAIATGGDIFFLDMGKPVNIKRMAEDLVRLSGRQPGKEVEIRVTGLRPGERLTEALVRDSEELSPTQYSQIARAVVRDFDAKQFVTNLDRLRLAAEQRDEASSAHLLADLSSLF